MNNQFKLQINSIFKSRKRTKNTKFESFIFPILLFFFFFPISTKTRTNPFEKFELLHKLSNYPRLSYHPKKFINSQDFEEPFTFPRSISRNTSQDPRISISIISHPSISKNTSRPKITNNFHFFQPRITFLDPRETQVSRPTQTPSIIKTAASNRFPAEGKKTSCGNRTSLDTRLIDDLSRPFLCPETLRIPSEKLRRLDGIRSWKSGRLREII